jgi:hypothetical protein
VGPPEAGQVPLLAGAQNVTLDELRSESYFPLDEPSQRVCERLAAS